MTTDQKWIENAEKRLDLREQIGELGNDEGDEFQISEWSPGRKLVHIWDTESGEEHIKPKYIAEHMLSKMRADGKGRRFTTNKANVPERKLGKILCYFHPDSPEREWMDELGITLRCTSAHLPNRGAARTHAENRHPTAWSQYQEAKAELKETEDRERQDRRDETMMKLVTPQKEAK